MQRQPSRQRSRVLQGAVLALIWAVPRPLAAQGFEPRFAVAAEITAEHREALGSYRMPVGPWRPIGGAVVVAEGAIRQTAYRLPIGDGSTMQILADLRAQMQAEGFEPLFECDAKSCGGFDFRFDTNVLPEPEMHVDLGDFRYFAARRPGEGVPELTSLLVSRSSESGFVQIYRLTAAQPGTDPDAEAGTSAANAPALPDLAPAPDPALPAPDLPQAGQAALSTMGAAAGSLGQMLESGGRVALDDLSFATGSAELAEGDYASLQALADYLAANPTRRAALVGHTDAMGGLDANIALSRRRAASVMAHLVGELGVSRDQISAEGVGYLVPRTSNLTESGRAQNRRVEVVLTSTQ